MTIDITIISGTTAALPAFEAAVEAASVSGYQPMGGPVMSGTDIKLAMWKDVAEPYSSFAPVYPIVAVTPGTGTGSFSVSGNQTQQFNPGFRFQVRDSTGNNGFYTVSPAGSSYSSPNTVIPVIETVASVVADGNVVCVT